MTRFLIDSGLAVSSEASPRLLRDIALSHATLSDAQLPNADLSRADLRGADLSDANLSRADLSHANLTYANLRGADLSDADLGGAKGWTEEQLMAAELLIGATMPNGQKYEDWLKSKDRVGDGENRGSS